jgi:hypothetical protein
VPPLARLALGSLAGATLALGGAVCGGGEGDGGEPVPGGADPEAVRVIDEWSTALREGDVERAASYFELPSVAQNGTPPLRLETTEDVIAFNDALPCGAELIEARSEGAFTVATFRLTDRPGGGCGPGTGGTASTRFQITDGKITEWRRVPEEPTAPGDEPGRVV